MERRMEQFQNRVQTNINLADDEIARLQSYLSTVQGEILDVKDKLNSHNIKSAQVQQEVIGRKKRSQAQIDAKIARMKADHHSKIQEIQQLHSDEIKSMQHDFEDTMAQLDQITREKTQKRVGPIEDVMKQTEMTIKKMKDSFGSSERAAETEAINDIKSLQELQYSRQQRLEVAVQKRNQERLESLVQAKTRLSDCVNTLEEMERNHTISMENYKRQLEAMDNRYQEKIKRDSERQNRTTEGLSRKYAEYEKRYRALQRTIKKIKQHHQQQIEEAVREGETLKLTAAAYETQTTQSTKEISKIQSNNKLLIDLKRKLETRENELAQARTNNESMKREIARLKHEIRLRKRNQDKPQA